MVCRGVAWGALLEAVNRVSDCRGSHAQTRAGLSCKSFTTDCAMQRCGVSCTVLEATSRVGGRVSTASVPGFAAPLDLGASIITGAVSTDLGHAHGPHAVSTSQAAMASSQQLFASGAHLPHSSCIIDSGPCMAARSRGAAPVGVALLTNPACRDCCGCGEGSAP